MDIPCLLKLASVLNHERAQAIEFMRTKTMRFSNADWIKPELSNIFAMLYMDMHRLRSLKAAKEKTKT